jgi:hypothetical protein
VTPPSMRRATFGMIEAGQELALAAEAFFDLVGGQGQRYHLDGGRHAEGSIGAFGQVDGAHASASEHLHGLPCAKPRQRSRGRGGDGLNALAMREQEGDSSAEVLIGAAVLGDQRVAPGTRRQFQRSVKDLLDFVKAFPFSRVHCMSTYHGLKPVPP